MTYDELKDLWTGGAQYIETRTSGSTGLPKTILLSRRLVRDSAWRTIRAFNLSRDSWLHSCLSPDSIGGKMQCIRAVELGAKFTSEHPSNSPLDWFGPTDWLSLVSVVPSQVPHILDRLEGRTLPLIETILVGGAPIPPSLRRRIATTNLNVWESYGMTETASHIAVRKVTVEPQPFVPLPGVKVSVNEGGCLRILLPDTPPIDTNDLAEITPQGFTILGRADNAIVSGGHKIIPEEIEALLGLSDREIAVTSLPDDKWGEKAVAVICRADRREAATEAIRSIEPHWKRPKEVILLPEIPLTPTGKIDRRRLKKEVFYAKKHNS